jgi:c(7)-type cytochrome triheme protein
VTRPRLRFAVPAALAALVAPSALATLGDIVYPRQAGSGVLSPAVFPHEVHRARFKCYVCHDAIFPMKAGVTLVTMDAIQAGKFCGTCHNGKTAFAVDFNTCGRCHR